MAKKGLLIVISGPSGVGKGTIRQYFMEKQDLNLVYSISMTTRLPRAGEVDGKDYFFVTKEQFETSLEKGELLEHAEFVGNYYGTPLPYVERLRSEGKNVVLEIEVQGFLQVKKKCPDALTIFIVPPSMEELERRIRGRKSEADEVVKARLAKAEKEMRLTHEYDYVVCNDDPQAAADRIATLIKELMEK